MPATGATSGVPCAAVTSWPWWMWPGRPAPKRAPAPPNEYAPATGNTPVADGAGAAGGGGGAWIVSVRPARRRGGPPQRAAGAVERLERDGVVARGQRGRLPRVGVAHAGPPVAEPQPDDARAAPQHDPHAHLPRPPAHAVGERHRGAGGDRGGGDGELARHRPRGLRGLEALRALRRLAVGHGPVAGGGGAAGGRVGRGRGGRQDQHADEHGRRARQGERAAHGTTKCRPRAGRRPRLHGIVRASRCARRRASGPSARARRPSTAAR